AAIDSCQSDKLVLNASNDHGSLLTKAVSFVANDEIRQKMVDFLIARGARIDQPDSDGDTALSLAWSSGDVSLVGDLLKQHAYPHSFLFYNSGKPAATYEKMAKLGLQYHAKPNEKSIAAALYLGMGYNLVRQMLDANPHLDLNKEVAVEHAGYGDAEY